MALFALNSRITIGALQFSGVHEVHIIHNMRSLLDSAIITIPSIANIMKKGTQTAANVTTGTLFNEGDAVEIELGYNGNFRSEFSGFVKRCGLGMPLVVECEGYVRQLRLNCDFNKHFTNTTAKKMLELATQGTDIEVVCQGDFPMSNFTLVHANGAQICDYIKEASDHVLTIFFIEPKKLWCGLVYTAYAAESSANIFGLPTVSYRLGFNCVKDNGLKERIPKEPVQIIMKGKYANGNFVTTASKNKSAANKTKVLLNHVPDEGVLKGFAQEKEYQHNYTGYEGKLEGFLQPYAMPGYDAVIKDKRYPKLDGTYLVEGTEVVFGVHGARRRLAIGPIVGFDK